MLEINFLSHHTKLEHLSLYREDKITNNFIIVSWKMITGMYILVIKGEVGSNDLM